MSSVLNSRREKKPAFYSAPAWFRVLDFWAYSALNFLPMDASTLINKLGGTSAVIEMTGLTKGRISQWRTENSIPKPWMMFFREKRPDIFGATREKARAA